VFGSQQERLAEDGIETAKLCANNQLSHGDAQPSSLRFYSGINPTTLGTNNYFVSPGQQARMTQLKRIAVKNK